MANSKFSIPRFYGAVYGSADNLTGLGFAAEAVNVDTSDGALQTLVGAVPYPDEIPADFFGTINLDLMWEDRSNGNWLFIGDDGKLYKISGVLSLPESHSAVALAYTPDSSTRTRLSQARSIFETSISGEAVAIALFLSGRPKVISYVNNNYSVRDFGTGLFITSDAITAVLTESNMIKNVSIQRHLTDAEKIRCYQAGVYIMATEDEELDFTAALVSDIIEVGETTTTFIFTDPLPQGSVSVGDYVKIRGGLSDRPVKYMCTYYSRLFAAGDPTFPNRLYWSCLPGDGRTIEDWSADDASPDTGGGHVEVGIGGVIRGLFQTQSQLLIWKDAELWRLYGATPSQYTLELVQSGLEVRKFNELRVADVKGILYFLFDDGLYYYDGSRLQKSSGDRSLLAYLQRSGVPARSYGLALNASRSDVTQIAFWRGNLYVYTQDLNARVFQYDLSTGAVTQYGFCGPLYVTTRGLILHGENGYSKPCILLDGINMVEAASILDPEVHQVITIGQPYENKWAQAYHKIPSVLGDKPIDAVWESYDLTFGEVSLYKRLRRVGLDITGPVRVLIKFPNGQLFDQTYVPTDISARRFLWIAVDMPYEYSFRIRFESVDGQPFRIHSGVDFYIETSQRN